VEKQGLSKREKMLLLVVGSVGLLAVMVQFVFLPMSNQLSAKRDTYDSLLMEKARIETSLATEANIRAKRDAALAAYHAISARFPYDSSSTVVGQLLTALCESHGLTPSDQKLSAPAVFSPDGVLRTAGDPAFTTVSVTMTVLGAYDDLKDVLDAVEQTDYLRISRVSFSRNNNDTQQGRLRELPGVEQDKITIQFVVVLLNEVD